jgi:hypothetical protein
MPLMRIVWFGIPHALMVLAGALLWKRYRSVASIIIAAGFAAGLLRQEWEILRGPAPLLTQYVDILCSWVGAAGWVL